MKNKERKETTTMINKTQGNRFERELCRKLADCGWWAYNFVQNQNGQPVDIIACKGNHTVLIDCKLCNSNRFVFSRMEENQINSITMFEHRTKFKGYFAIKFPTGNIYMLPYVFTKRLTALGFKSITEEQMDGQAWLLDTWLKLHNDDN